jgi:hypothetical protein
MTSSVSARLVVLAVLNGSTPQLAVTNLLGGNQLDETNLISTITTGATTAAVFSSSIVTGPYRVVGFIDITQATPGTWVSQPTTIQGAGGQALQSLSATSQNLGQNLLIYTASTSWIVPVGVSKCIVYAVGGGGGGYGSNVTGITASYLAGNGGYICAAITGLTAGAVISVTIGAGATSFAAAGSKQDGGTTSFGSYVTAYGGSGMTNSPLTPGADGSSAYASSGGVVVTPIRQITNTCGSTLIGTNGIYKNYYAGIPYFGGIPIGQIYGNGSGFTNPDYRSAWDKTTIFGAGGAGGSWSSGGTYCSGFGIAGALVIQY